MGRGRWGEGGLMSIISLSMQIIVFIGKNVSPQNIKPNVVEINYQALLTLYDPGGGL